MRSLRRLVPQLLSRRLPCRRRRKWLRLRAAGAHRHRRRWMLGADRLRHMRLSRLLLWLMLLLVKGGEVCLLCGSRGSRRSCMRLLQWTAHLHRLRMAQRLSHCAHSASAAQRREM